MDDSNANDETNWANSNTDNRESENGETSINSSRQIQQEIPFLVTHWLANYTTNSTISNVEAIAKIRKASLDIASAFETLGAFGTSLRYPLHSSSSLPSSISNQPVLQNRTFGDMNRRHSQLPPSHLENIAQSTAFNAAIVDSVAIENARTNFLLRVSSTRDSVGSVAEQTSNDSESTIASRRLDETFDRDTIGDISVKGSDLMQLTSGLGNEGLSILRNPTLISAKLQHDRLSTTEHTNSSDKSCMNDNMKKGTDTMYAERGKEQSPKIDVKSTYWQVTHQTAIVVRDFLSLREKYRTNDNEKRSLKASMAFQVARANKLKEEMNNFSENQAITAVEKIKFLENHKAQCQASDRVISQLTRKLSELDSSQITLKPRLKKLELKSRHLEERCRTIANTFHDPFQSWKGPLSKNSRIGGCTTLKTIVGRELGFYSGRFSESKIRSNLSTGLNRNNFLTLRKNLMSTRLSHAMTINAHLTCPVYCLRFDRTGRYFITGADDYLIKVFYLGAAKSCKRRSGVERNRRLRCNYGANFRGAVLVCTLKGHAGVINDIDVSMDNCFLATASDDGDVRVWGLKNGYPVAILRGHKGGANMVSWSTLTPYRLVSTSSDGFARVWDIRESCLKRYANMVSRRGEYNHRLTNEEKKLKNGHGKDFRNASEKSVNPGLLPPLPMRGDTTPNSNPLVPANINTLPSSQSVEPAREAASSEQRPSRIVENNNVNETGIIVPPLPVAVPPIGVDNHESNQNGGLDNNSVGGTAPGQFVANDFIDEGVKLLSKYQHGNVQEEHGPGTRSRRSAVNVICVARCPLGKQFVTGSDDGICRVWEDFDDTSIAIIDARLSNKNHRTILQCRKPSQSGIEVEPLLKLMGHVSTITDLAYSHSGDRILSASQKDGVVRVWNIGRPMTIGRDDKVIFKDKRVTQIVIKLTNPFSTKLSKPTRRRPGNTARNASSKVCCEVATWTHDDSFIVTSQSVLVKENGTEIQPGSHFICMWNSKTGRCLISISGAHTSQCPVVLPHPMDSSILCTASANGFVKLWDWTEGKCIFTHKNSGNSGPSNESEKNGGYLDGSFSPDGNSIVLTDDIGQITVLDSILEECNTTNTGNESVWMREQYFANDYYDLAYDRNGYCIERGSERPPHLAPKSARCAQNGSAYSDEINETFRRLSGPSPLPDNLCTWHREQIRAKRFSDKQVIRSSSREPTVRVSVREFDLRSTIIIRGVDHVGNEIENSKLRSTSGFDVSGSVQRGVSNERSSSRTMSSNFRYLDYDDLVRREGIPEEDEPDSDDEEFEPAAVRRHITNDEVESEDDDLDDLSIYSENNSRRRSRHRNQSSSRATEERRVRASRRAQRNDADFVEIGSDDEMIAQFVSVNRTPKGPYLRDYTIHGHYWRLRNASDANRVRRKWLNREESDSTYFGRNVYAPQIGDSIVYIPRAHFETIKECPSLSPPWQSWPMGAVWPVVRCFIRGIRFRFPYEDYFRNKQHAKCNSIVAILTLEVTGIPEISEDREFPWPKPSFIEPTRPFLFELSIFENSSCEYIISETLYISRIAALENHMRTRRNGVAGLEVDLYYEQDHGDQDLRVWPATIEEILSDEGHSDVHLQGSGFGVVQVWDGSDQNRDYVSPWELNTEGVNLTRPCMSHDEKESVVKELNRLLRKEEIADHLSMPVNQERYCDYANMIEIPMDLMFVKRRLAANFYGSKLGAAADLRLIRDNCIKYNTTENEMSDIAVTMCKEFESNILSEDERSQIITEEEFDKIHKEQSEGRQLSRMRIRLSARTIQEASQAAASSGGRYTLRGRTSAHGQSSLENLPRPNIDSTYGQQNRREVDTTSDTREVSNSRSRSSNDETEVLGQVARLRSERRSVSINGRNQSDSRTRATRNTFRGDEVRNSQQQQIPDGHRRNRRSSYNASQDRGQPRRPSAHSERNIEGSEEVLVAATSQSNMIRRSPRRSISHTSHEHREDEDIEGHTRSNDGIPDSRRLRRMRDHISQRTEEQDGDSDEEVGTDESEHGGGNSCAESQYTDQGDDMSVSSEEIDSTDLPQVTKGSQTSQRTTRSASLDPEPTQELPTRRSSRRKAQKRHEVYNQSESESDESENLEFDSERNVGKNSYVPSSEDKLSLRRSSRRSATNKPTLYEEIESDTNEPESEILESKNRSSVKKSSRRNTARDHVSRRNIDADSEDNGSNTDDSKSMKVSGTYFSKSEPPKESSGRRSSRRSAVKNRVSYEEVESDAGIDLSDFENTELINDGNESTEEELSKPKRNASKRKRKTGDSKKLTTKKARNEPISLPELRQWPKIDVGDITKVSREMLKRVSEDDASGVFSKPVVEVHPGIADAYLDVIKTPMDLQTIEEERVNIYDSIHMLQADLILMYRNCSTFNGRDSPLGQIALTQWESINQTFFNVCMYLGILLPRHWRP